MSSLASPVRRGAAVVALVLVGCGGSPARPTAPAKATPPTLDDDAPWLDPASFAPARTKPTARPLTDAVRNVKAPTLAITNATILTATGQRFERGTLVLIGGAIAAVGGSDVAVPDGATIIDGTGKVVTPGLIDAHSHLGVYSAPSAHAHDDGNEATAPVTAGVRAEYGYWPADPQIARALAGGVTTALILPGSANLIGGRGFTVVMRPARTAAEAAFPGAPSTIKMACGENPKRVYGEKGGPSTRMGEYAALRATFAEAARYAGKLAAYGAAHQRWRERQGRAEAADRARGDGKRIAGEEAPTPPDLDLKLETLVEVLAGRVLVQVHCYRADDMGQMMAIADEAGFTIRSFHHALEAYKVRDLLAARGIAINTWSDWWGFKLEAFDGIPENAALMTEAGGRATIHSDSAIGIQRLNQDAAKALAAGRRAGIALDDDVALKWITANPAWVLGLDGVTGALKPGLRADVVLWNASPWSVYAKADLVIINGEVAYDRARGLTPSDFELGHGAIDRSTP